MESQNLEYKRAWKDEYLKILASFANSDGDKLYIGIDDDGTVVGVKNPEKLLNELPQKVKNHLHVTPNVRLLEKDNKIVVEIQINPADFLVFYEGKVYKRTGNTTQEVRGPELNSMLLKKTGCSWDSVPTDIKVEDLGNILDFNTFERFVKMSSKRLPEIINTDMKTSLENLQLIKDDKLTRAGLLLFGKDPTTYFQYACIRGGRFSGPIIKDSKDFKGNLFSQLEKVIEFIKSHISVKYEIKPRDLSVDELSRREIWEYPLEALREAIINAIIHRDYSDYTSCVEIRIYDDSVEISNPGCLLPPLSIDDLRRPYHFSKTRNPLIASVFYYAGLIEKWGTGTARMVDMCIKHGLPEPEFENRERGLGNFKVIFYKDVITEKNLRKLGLNERQIKAVLYVKEFGEITNRKYRELNNVSDETARLELLDLVNKEILKQVGKGRNVLYKLK